eukprot:1155609-Pelagomonas_calceolata.AAC.2
MDISNGFHANPLNYIASEAAVSSICLLFLARGSGRQAAMWRQAAIWSFDCSSQKIRMLYSSMTALVHVSKLFAEVQELKAEVTIVLESAGSEGKTNLGDGYLQENLKV